MNEVLTVPTAFGDISDMAQGLVDRVDEQQIILYGPNPYDEGSELGFELLLLDGTPALEGRGIVSASVDGGEERDPSTRFDIVLHGLHFDGAAEVVFERMVMTRLSMVGDAPPSEEVADVSEDDLDSAAFESVEVESSDEAAPAEPEDGLALDDAASFAAGGFEDEATVVANVADPAVLAALEAANSQAEAELVQVEEPEPEPEPAHAADPDPEPEPEPAYAAEPEPAEDAYAEGASTEPSSDEAEAEEPFEAPSADDALSEPAYADAEPSPSEPPPARAFSQPPRGPDSLRPTAADLEVRPGAEPPEPPAPPTGFAIDNSLSGGLVRSHSVWSPVAPPPPEPRPSSGLFQYAAGPIPLPDRPPRPDLDPSLRVQRAPAPMREGEAPPAEVAASIARSERHQADFDDALMSDAVELDPVTVDE